MQPSRAPRAGHTMTTGCRGSRRLALNLFLSAAGLTRIIIPTAFRDGYISALKAMSGNGYPVPLVRMSARAARFSRWLDMRSRDAAFTALQKASALGEPTVARLSFDEREIPGASEVRPNHSPDS